jgi:hypothetical protein
VVVVSDGDLLVVLGIFPSEDDAFQYKRGLKNSEGPLSRGVTFARPILAAYPIP